MSEYDYNGFETGETTETVETVENVETVSDAGAYESTYESTYESAPEYDSTTTYSAPENGGSKVFGIISLVCGIVSLLCSCCGWIGIVLAVAAIVLGILSINKQEDAKGMAIAGIACGGVGLLIGIVIVIIGGAISSLDSNSVEDFVERIEDSL